MPRAGAALVPPRLPAPGWSGGTQDGPWQTRPFEAPWQWACNFICVLYLLK